MRHNVKGFKLGRNTAHRKAMWRNMAVSLFMHGRITTTVQKAKSVKPFVEKLISLAKKGDLASRRRAIAALGNQIVVRSDDDDEVTFNKYGEVTDGPRIISLLFDEIGPRYLDRAGGYTRVVRLGKHRIGDGGDLAVLELVGDEEGTSAKGRYSRRRQIADNRTAYAAKLRKGPQEEEAAAVPVEDEASTGVDQGAVEASSDAEAESKD